MKIKNLLKFLSTFMVLVSLASTLSMGSEDTELLDMEQGRASSARGGQFHTQPQNENEIRETYTSQLLPRVVPNCLKVGALVLFAISYATLQCENCIYSAGWFPYILAAGPAIFGVVFCGVSFYPLWRR